MEMQHKSLAEGRWAELSFCEQMANVGSGVSRTKNWLVKGMNSRHSGLLNGIVRNSP